LNFNEILYSKILDDEKRKTENDIDNLNNKIEDNNTQVDNLVKSAGTADNDIAKEKYQSRINKLTKEMGQWQKQLGELKTKLINNEEITQLSHRTF